jgi:hypothetical protein
VGQGEFRDAAAFIRTYFLRNLYVLEIQRITPEFVIQSGHQFATVEKRNNLYTGRQKMFCSDTLLFVQCR